MMASKKINKNDGVDAATKVSRTASERISDLFTEAFQKVISNPKNNINVDEFECAVQKKVGSKDVIVDVRIYGFAGNTTQDEFCKKEKDKKQVLLKKGAEKVSIVLDDDTPVDFKFWECRNLDATDYLISYKVG